MTEPLTLLLADDEVIIRKKVRMILGGIFRVDEAATAAEAREAASKGYDAILLDIMFPDGNGIDLCREIKQKDPHTTVLTCSSMETLDAWNQAFQAGADGYLEKRDLLALDPRKIALIITNLVERNRLRREAEDSSRRQAALLSVLSHDVRAPFQAFLGTIELLKKCDIPENAARNVDILHQRAREQLALINSLLELLRLESKATQLRFMQVDVNLAVNQSVQGLGVLAADKEISLETDLEPRLPRIKGDIARIAQVVNNLITNAIKFTPRGGRVTVRTAAAERNGIMGAEIIVSDTGVGISPKDQEMIFQGFQRGHAGTEGEKGTGLGLAICKEIVQLHNGTLELTSENCCGAVARAWFAPASEHKQETVETEPGEHTHRLHSACQ
jgi:signal transduction histidine kinase